VDHVVKSYNNTPQPISAQKSKSVVLSKHEMEPRMGNFTPFKPAPSIIIEKKPEVKRSTITIQQILAEKPL
jgi:hypothetical protein